MYLLGERHICVFSFDIYSSVGKELSDASGKLPFSVMDVLSSFFFPITFYLQVYQKKNFEIIKLYGVI